MSSVAPQPIPGLLRAHQPVLQENLVADFPQLESIISGNGLLLIQAGIMVVSLGLAAFMAYRLRPKKSKPVYGDIKPSSS